MCKAQPGEMADRDPIEDVRTSLVRVTRGLEQVDFILSNLEDNEVPNAVEARSLVLGVLARLDADVATLKEMAS